MIQAVSKTFTGNTAAGEIGSVIRGRLLAVKVVADSSVTNNWDLVLSGFTSAVPILTDTAIANNATEWFYPRALASKVADGSAATDAFCEIPLFKESVRAVITNAGTTGSITITIYYDDSVNQ